jgi:hypothetical protein
VGYLKMLSHVHRLFRAFYERTIEFGTLKIVGQEMVMTYFKTPYWQLRLGMKKP